MRSTKAVEYFLNLKSSVGSDLGDDLEYRKDTELLSHSFYVLTFFYVFLSFRNVYLVLSFLQKANLKKGPVITLALHTAWTLVL